MWLPLILGIIAGIFLGIMITSMCAAGAIADKDREIARLKELHTNYYETPEDSVPRWRNG